METSPQPQPSLRPWVKPVAGLLGVVVILGIVSLPWLVRSIPLGSIHLGSMTEAPIQPAVLPEAYTEQVATYGEIVKEQPTPQPATTPVQLGTLVTLPQTAPPPPTSLLPQGQQPAHDLSRVPVAVPIQDGATPGRPPETPTRQPQGQRQGPRRPTKQAWVVKPTDITIRDSINPSPEAQRALQDEAQAQQLIKHALWARPGNVKKTLYRQQSIPGITLDEMVSSIPGQYRIRVTVPVFNRFYPDYELIPKDSIVIVKQEGGVGYGEERLKVGVDEIQPPTPEVITLHAAVGGEQGQAGLTGHVNNHYGKLVLATLISTALNIGPRILAGSPQGYNYNIGQEVSREAGQQVANDARSIVDKQLRVPPTITIPANTPVSITLSENVTFARQPIVVR